MKILTGDVIPTSGSAYLGGLNIATRQRMARRLIGYCPQFDALHDFLTVEEHLELYAKIKGVDNRHVTRVVNDKIRQLDLEQFRKKLSKGLSGGNKRKLSAAIALIGNPSIVFMDEPSTGMDPAARRKMWDVIADVCDSGFSTVILTTHSMEECEALCSRIGILVSGRLQCLGGAQHLKARFGHGYTIHMNLNLPSDHDMKDMIRQMTEIVGSAEVQNLSLAMVDQICSTDRRRFEMVSKCSGSAWVFEQYLENDSMIPIEVFASWWIQEDQVRDVGAFSPQNLNRQS